ncbi:MAG TPA: glycosyltransferase family 9 protein [Verrucomicrobiae bacterium]|nr:glycosyltransferase family 9 protein [Verrucomicrobiae bacterium]
MTAPLTKPRLLIIELWGLGDLAIATPFLRAAIQKYDITILAKPYAKDLQSRLWPEIKVLPFVAPWTAFRGKYHLHAWPWRQMLRLEREIRSARFDVGLSARWDPRDHFLLAFAGAKRRLGFPRMGSRIFLTDPLLRADPEAHRYENWRILGRALGLELPAREALTIPRSTDGQPDEILIHTGAGQPIRVWPLENYRKLITRLREKQYQVQVACDPGQRDWWLQNGETGVATPKTVAELQALVDKATVVIGNDSGPGHLASFAGVPTFTIFGPQLPEWFAPLHPTAQWVEGKACPYKPCSDYCRFPEPICLTGWTEPEIWTRIEPFVKRVSNGR